MPVLKQSTAPFVAETTTLLSMYQVALPFGVLTSQLPRISNVRKFAYTLKEVPIFPYPDPCHFILVFFDASLLPFPDNLRPYLLSDETADRSTQAERARARGLRVLTTWMWDGAEKTASFYLREDAMQAMRRGRWNVAIFRTDSWIFQSLPSDISEIKDTGINWMQS